MSKKFVLRPNRGGQGREGGFSDDQQDKLLPTKSMFGRNSGPPPLVVSWRSLARLAKVGQLFHRPSIAAQQALLQVVEWFLQLHDLAEIWGLNTISEVL